MHYTFAEISLSAIDHNIKEIKKLLPAATKFMAVVKANAYGHGSVEVSKQALQSGADILAVASVKEALELREAGIDAPILVLSETSPELVDYVIDNDLTQTVYTQKLAKLLSQAAEIKGKKVKVHVKVDTGMGRVGVAPPDAINLIKSLSELPGLELEGIFTHFAVAEEKNGFTDQQLERFNLVTSELKKAGITIPILHAANSAATLFHKKTYLNMARVGLLMYGLKPNGNQDLPLKLKPALAFKSKVLYLKKVSKGTPLSYGCTYTTPDETQIATIPVGYADGYSRSLSNKGMVLINGKRYPVVGRVCMDLTLVNVFADEIKLEDEVVLIGKQGNEEISASELADLENTINYEIVCSIGKRVPRIYV
ncbi:MAG: alanine racemase [Candidatus Margulisbacteria bacterium]|nr:alanine racemase [Candidatus Margulisiibacteriota bacterium]MBU1021389.1 alanine racemase [Candidatus Margulisiibacteriota bacterium]MBU1729122.1 alanine racemase [Candidatus Margulisiibacteriota bacterium]MBU1954795.1 alanine racemase [Candidatus Margulisiibacteriota bacterium]